MTNLNINLETMNAEEVAQKLDDHLEPFGIEVPFKSTEDFKKSLLSGQPLVLTFKGRD